MVLTMNGKPFDNLPVVEETRSNPADQVQHLHLHIELKISQPVVNDTDVELVGFQIRGDRQENVISTQSKHVDGRRNSEMHHGCESRRTHNWQNEAPTRRRRREDVGVHVHALGRRRNLRPIVSDFYRDNYEGLEYEGFKRPCPSTSEELSVSD